MKEKKLDLINSSLFEKDKTILGMREETPIEKGVSLTETYLEQIFDLLQKYMEFFSAYPDLFIDLISQVDDEFQLFFYQRIILRACMRYKEFYLTACRATSKTFISILALILQCIFIPRTKRFIVAPFKIQAAKVAKEKILEIYRHWPLLRREVIGGDILEEPGNFSKDYCTLKFRNGSQLDIIGGDSTRGLRREGGLLDELRDADGDEISQIVLPLLNVSRRLPNNTVNPKEPNCQTLIMTSAGTKIHYSYDKLIEVFENSIISPQSSLAIGIDYRIPMMHGLLDRNFVNKLKLSPSYNAMTFAAEYLAVWQGSSADSWFNFEKMSRYRKLKNPELRAYPSRIGNKGFYLIAADIGRLHDQTEVLVFRINEINNTYHASIVNIITLGKTPETRPFNVQARDLKKIIFRYEPKEVVIDTNGLGIGLADEMIKPQFDTDGMILPALGFFNNDDYELIQPKSCPRILYSMKANGPLKSLINSNVYSRLSSGKIHFLIKEQEAKSLLLATERGKKMPFEERMVRLYPHEMTTKLFEQAANLRLRRTGVGLDIVLEQINTRFADDKYSALSYGLWRIKELEETLIKTQKNPVDLKRQLIFFSGGQ